MYPEITTLTRALLWFISFICAFALALVGFAEKLIGSLYSRGRAGRRAVLFAGVMFLLVYVITSALAAFSPTPSPLFVDVPPDSDAYAATAVLHDAGVVAGCGNDPQSGRRRFCPGDPLRLEELTVMIWRLRRCSGMPASEDCSQLQPAPVTAISSPEAGPTVCLLPLGGLVVFDDLPVSAGDASWIPRWACAAVLDPSLYALVPVDDRFVVVDGTTIPVRRFLDRLISRGEAAIALAQFEPQQTYGGPQIGFDDIADPHLFPVAQAAVARGRIALFTYVDGTTGFCPGCIITRREAAIWIAQLLALN